MRLNELRPGLGSKRLRKRIGRGGGSGTGRTAGRGHKGQKSRSGGGIARGFEGGQMPLQRRLPKFGFHSRKARFADQIRLDQLVKMEVSPIDLEALKAAKKVSHRITRVKIINSGVLEKAVTIKGLSVTAAARAVIETAGGTIIP